MPDVETFVLTMPREADFYLAALCVLESFTRMTPPSWKGRYFLERVDPKYQDILPEGLKSSKIEAIMFSNSKILMNEEVSVYFDFDVDKAYRISEKTKIHLTQAFGIMLGSEPETVFPYFRPMILGQEHRGVVLIADGNWDVETRDTISNWMEKSKIRFKAIQASELHLLELFETVSGAEMVIGKASAGTYLAAGLGKTVVELYPEDVWHRGFMAKYGCGPYHMVPEPVEQQGTLWAALEVAWRSIHRLRA